MSTTLYKFCHVCVQSDLPLDLPKSDCERPDWFLTVIDSYGPDFSQIQPFMKHQMPNGQPWLTLAKDASSFYLHFTDLADFRISPEAAEICCFPCSGTPLNTIRHLFLDQVMPRTLSQLGHLVLHAGSIGVSGKAIAFIGDAGWGKSTLTASLGQAGFSVLTDDCLTLQEEGTEWLGIGSYPGLRLWPDSRASLNYDGKAERSVAHYSRKARMIGTDLGIDFCLEQLPVRHIYLLSAPQESDENVIRIDPLSLRESVIRFLEHAFRLDITDRERNAREFETLTRLAEKLPMYRLSYPHRYDMLPAVREAILAHLQETS